MRTLMMIWMSMSLITDLHWWGPWWWSECLCPWSWPALMRTLMLIWMSMSDHWPALMRPWWWSECLGPWSLMHWWGPWWCSECLCPWSLTCTDEDPDEDLNVYVPDHWPALMRTLMIIWMSMSDHWPALISSLMMIWMSMSLINNLHWWDPWWWSECLCPWEPDFRNCLCSCVGTARPRCTSDSTCRRFSEDVKFFHQSLQN